MPSGQQQRLKVNCEKCEGGTGICVKRDRHLWRKYLPLRKMEEKKMNKITTTLQVDHLILEALREDISSEDVDRKSVV